MKRFSSREVLSASTAFGAVACLACLMISGRNAVAAAEVSTAEPRAKSSASTQPEASQAATPQAEERGIEHPDGSGKWQEWGIKPRTLTREKRFQQRSIIDSLLGPRSNVRTDILLELAGKKEIDKAQPIFDILGVASLPREPTQRSMPLSDDALRSFEGFELLGGWIASSPQMRRAGASRDQLSYSHAATRERMHVGILYDESSADALRHFIVSSHVMFNATLGQVLPTCRIVNGPGDFCWLGWSRTNEEHSVYYPSDADILFIRNGVAVLVTAQDAAKHDFAMDLARKIDALLLKQSGRRPPDAPSPTGVRD